MTNLTTNQTQIPLDSNSSESIVSFEKDYGIDKKKNGEKLTKLS